MIDKGSFVILTHQLFIPTPEYPVWPSEFQCVGTVEHITGDGRVMIKWANGMRRELMVRHLTEIKDKNDPRLKLNPNIEFLKKFSKQKRRS
jgi:hypothetical protein